MRGTLILADGFTKGLSEIKMREFCRRLGLTGEPLIPGDFEDIPVTQDEVGNLHCTSFEDEEFWAKMLLCEDDFNESTETSQEDEKQVEDVHVKSFDLEEVVTKYVINVASGITERVLKGNWCPECPECPSCPTFHPNASSASSESCHPAPSPSSSSTSSTLLITAAAAAGSIVTVAAQSLKSRLRSYCQRRRMSSASSSSLDQSVAAAEKPVKSKRSKVISGTQTNVVYSRGESKFKNIGVEADTYCEFSVKRY
jgi:hypothetical protein